MCNERRRIEARSNEGSVTTAFNVKLHANGNTTEDLQRLDPARRRRRPCFMLAAGRAWRAVHYLVLSESAERRIRTTQSLHTGRRQRPRVQEVDVNPRCGTTEAAGA